MQRKSLSPAPGSAPVVHDVLRSSGQPLPGWTRQFLEPRLSHAVRHIRATPASPVTSQQLRISDPGDSQELEADGFAERVLLPDAASQGDRTTPHDLSRIRIHADAPAAEAAHSVNALAFTVGKHIVFGGGLYNPDSPSGLRLLAHELAHTLQQAPGLARQAKDVPDRPLRPHDPTPQFAPGGACLGSAICKDLLTPSKLLKQAEADPGNKEKRERRKQLCKKQPPDPACTAEGHGSPATEVKKLLHDYDPSRLATGAAFVVDRDMEKDFGALTLSCNKFVPPISGAVDCVAVPVEMEQQAAQFNNTQDPMIGGEQRGTWREHTLEKLVHESEHTRFRAAYRTNTVLATEPACSNMDTLLALNELTAMLQEHPLRMEFIRSSVGLSPEQKQAELEEFRRHRILGTTQSITVSLRTVRCACNCDDANKLIRETIEFATSSWTQQQKNDLHREMRDSRWTDLDLRWPFVAPPIPDVPRPTPERTIQRKCACGQQGSSGDCEECKKERLQRKGANADAAAMAPPIVREVLSSPGQPLDAAPRAFMEESFRHDFSGVRVHTDERAAHRQMRSTRWPTPWERTSRLRLVSTLPRRAKAGACWHMNWPIPSNSVAPRHGTSTWQRTMLRNRKPSVPPMPPDPE